MFNIDSFNFSTMYKFVKGFSALKYIMFMKVNEYFTISYAYSYHIVACAMLNLLFL